MTLFVLDPSVAAKWVLPGRGETLAEEALQLLRRNSNREIEFIAPDFFWAEFGKILWKAVQRRRWSGESATEALLDFRKLRVSTIPTSGLLDEALAIAIGTGRSVYDCLYVAHAERENCELVTADDKLIKNLQSAFPFIRALATIP